MVHIHIEVRSAWRTSLISESKQRTYKSRFITELKQDEYSLNSKPTLKRWSNSSPTVEPRWARPKTDHQAPANLTESFMPEPSLNLSPTVNCYWPFQCGASAVVHFYLLVLLNLLVAGYYIFICRIFYYYVLRVFYNICNEPQQNLEWGYYQIKQGECESYGR